MLQLASRESPPSESNPEEVLSVSLESVWSWGGGGGGGRWQGGLGTWGTGS